LLGGEPKIDSDHTKYFSGAVLNTSRNHFLHGAKQQKALFDELWKDTLKTQPIFHLRVIISWAGFTGEQLALVKQFNRMNPTQPIVLVYPKGMRNNIYGAQATFQLSQFVSDEPWKKGIRGKEPSMAECTRFNNVASMLLEPEELNLGLLDVGNEEDSIE
jgi:hypothetical protein